MQLVDLPGNPMPPGGRCEAVTAADGVVLRCASWPARTAQPLGTVCLFHGRSEFIEKFAEVIGDLLARGFAVATLDWRGQGGSARARGLPDARLGHVGSFDEYGLDLDAFMRGVALPDCPSPFFALAHSMGAAILLGSLGQRPGWFERVVAVSPMVAIARPPRGARLLAEALCLLGRSRAITPGWRLDPVVMRPFDGNPVTRDAVRYARAQALVRAEPALGLGGPTIGWVRAAFRREAMLSRGAMAEAWRTPTLMLLAGEERIVSNAAAQRLAEVLRATSAVTVPGALHEMMQERDAVRDRFWSAFDAFVPGRGDGAAG